MKIISDKPLLRHSDLTGAIYVVTRYRTPDDGRTIEALTKFDVTDQFIDLGLSLGEAWWLDRLPGGDK